MKELSLEQVGKRLRRVREQLGQTREQFAEQAGISPQFLAELENGKKGMSAETLFKICTRFDQSADYLLLGRHSDASDPVLAALERVPEPYASLTEELIRTVERFALGQ